MKSRLFVTLALVALAGCDRTSKLEISPPKNSDQRSARFLYHVGQDLSQSSSFVSKLDLKNISNTQESVNFSTDYPIEDDVLNQYVFQLDISQEMRQAIDSGETVAVVYHVKQASEIIVGMLGNTSIGPSTVDFAPRGLGTYQLVTVTNSSTTAKAEAPWPIDGLGDAPTLVRNVSTKGRAFLMSQKEIQQVSGAGLESAGPVGVIIDRAAQQDSARTVPGSSPSSPVIPQVSGGNPVRDPAGTSNTTGTPGVSPSTVPGTSPSQANSGNRPDVTRIPDIDDDDQSDAEARNQSDPVDESQNRLGPNRCEEDRECAGDRTCSIFGWCQNPPVSQGSGAVDESQNRLGPNRCSMDRECSGSRTCSAFGWCQEPPASSNSSRNVDESQNELGANRCSTDRECSGSRTCSAFGWCQNPPTSSTSNRNVDESQNSLGANRCSTDRECSGSRTCSAFGWCQNPPAVTSTNTGRTVDESQNRLGPNRCEMDRECSGFRVCSAHGWCQNP